MMKQVKEQLLNLEKQYNTIFPNGNYKYEKNDSRRNKANILIKDIINKSGELKN